MYIVTDYSLAIVFCFITMLCWGSWGNTQKLASKNWRFELFYWDYVIGITLFSIICAFTLGSIGDSGRAFTDDLRQADTQYIRSAFIGGIIFNAANIMLSAAIAIAGMSVAFPVGIGIALILGVIVNYAGEQKGDPLLLFAGVLLVMIAIILNAIAYKRKTTAQSKMSGRGIMLAIAAGLLMSFFYRFIAAGMDLSNFESPAAGKMTPYTAVFIFSLGVFASNFLFNSILIRRPITGPPTSYAEYFRGSLKTHLTGVLGGLIWGLGNSLNLIAAGIAGAAISYGLGQGATLVAALWGVFVWKEFAGASQGTKRLLLLMFVCFLAGIILLIYAGR